MYEKEKAMNWLRKRLPQDRFEHSVGAMKMAGELAVRYGVDRDKAEFAGLVHDCAKGMTGEELLNFCDEHGIEVNGIYRLQPLLLHGAVGAVIVKNEFKTADQDILNAIRFHTTGRRGMSTLEKIVYLADLIEPARKFPGADELRKLAAESLNRAMFKAIGLSIGRVISKGKMIDPNSIDAWNEIAAGDRD